MFAFNNYNCSSKETNGEYETRMFLDCLPWNTLLTQGRDLYELMDSIQSTYGPAIKNNPTFDGEVFNWMGIEEFADYIRTKGYYVCEDVSIKYTIGGRKNGTN